MLGYKKRVRASVVSQRRSYGHSYCDSVLHSSWDSNCVVRWSLFCIAVGTAIAWCGGRCAMPDAHWSCCSGGDPWQPWSSGLVPVSRFHSSIPLSHSSPSLIGSLAAVDIKQQKLTLSGAGRATILIVSSCLVEPGRATILIVSSCLVEPGRATILIVSSCLFGAGRATILIVSSCLEREGLLY